MRRALHVEWTKLRTVRGTGWLLLAVVVLTVGLSVLADAADGGTARDSAKVALTGVQVGQAVVAVLAVLAMGGEYASGMIKVTLTALPRRVTVLVAKAAVVGGLVLVAAAAAVFACAAAGGLSLTSGPVLRATAGSVLYLVLVGLLSLGVATTVRDTAAAIGIVLGLLYVFPIVASVVGDPDWYRHLQQIGPMTAGLAIQVTAGVDTLPIAPWAGLGVLAAWAAAALGAGGLALHLRDA
ncbi:ABC transporter permease [Amycolatopsis taiwanensis]|uniref:ABC transporter n=1 Tax=Amycolatopsis taiwanensis TaxID=342230 RepID=A0A9W6VI92_9PSEU|nr:ABC transporter permease [Amycolatopsis taiwanensis]GLY68197.1 ABC transporter [Amycolatopsis taiwanensis]